MDHLKKRNLLWGMIYSFLLIAFTVYVLMDTFVIVKVYAPAVPNDSAAGSYTDSTPSPENSADGSQAQAPTGSVTENTYEDENISIVLTEYREYDTNIHVAEVQLSSPEYLKTAFAHGAYGLNIKEDTSQTAQDINAILAINGDFYGAREKGYVLRNGVLYRNTSAGKEDLVIYKDGTFSMIVEGKVAAEDLLAEGAEQVFSFGPALITDGELSASVSNRSGTKNPRTAIGLIDDLHYLFVVTDGRTDDSKGLAYFELAEFMLSLGVKEAYNLDGGGSSAMYFNGNVINTMYHGSEREVSDIVYIGY